MKMFDKNGNMTVITRAVFDINMERLRAGDSPLEIAQSLHEQTKLIEYNGHMIDSSGAPTIWYWAAFKIGQNKWNKIKPKDRIQPFLDLMNVGVIHNSELNAYLGAWHIPNGTRPVIDATLVP